MRTPLVLLLLALAGILGGGALIGTAALGGCLIFDSLAVGAWAVLTADFPEPARKPSRPVFVEDYLQRKAAENW